MNLLLKYLTPYIPYQLKVYSNFDHIDYLLAGVDIQKSKIKLIAINNFKNEKTLSLKKNGYNIKPILRSLNDLTDSIEYQGETIVPLYYLMREDSEFTLDFIDTFGYEELKVSTYEKLLEWNFDIFQLIIKGLAVDIKNMK